MNHWPAASVELWPLEKLVPYARNSRTHTPAQISRIAASIREWGFTTACLVAEDGTLIAGHARLQAAQQLGLTQVPVMVAHGWTEAQRRAYVIADNQLTIAGSGWNEELLQIELEDLKDLDFNLDLIGFEPLELEKLFKSEEHETVAGEDEEPAIQQAPQVSQFGDVWICGRHRLMCGDSTNAAMMAQLTHGRPIDLCFTSPPYTMKREYETNVHEQDWDGLMDGVFQAVGSVMAPHGQILVNLGMQHEKSEWQPYWDGWIARMRASGWRRFGWYVWDKGAGLYGDWRGRLAPAHEFIFHFNKQSIPVNKCVPCKAAGHVVDHGLRGTTKGAMNAREDHNPPQKIADTKVPDSVIRIPRSPVSTQETGDHPAVFPIKLAESMIEAYTQPNGAVLEPFSGSGSTLLAAERLNRCAFAMEIASRYVDVAVLRWQEMTGEEAILEGMGMGYTDVQEQRDGNL